MLCVGSNAEQADANAYAVLEVTDNFLFFLIFLAGAISFFSLCMLLTFKLYVLLLYFAVK